MEKKTTKELDTRPIIETFNESEAFLYNRLYDFIKGYAHGKNLPYVWKALPLARKFHNGQYRNGTIKVGDTEHKLPYVHHVLTVCSTLITLELDRVLNHQDLDILLTAALLHDTIEDCSEYFPQGGIELVNEYGLPYAVYETILLVSKASGCTDEQLQDYFNNIKRNRFALLIKLADRAHNVGTLYNMKPARLHKYVRETRMFIYPLATYGKANYPELSNVITNLKREITNLTENTEILVNMCETQMNEQTKRIAELEAELAKLKGMK